MTVDAPLPAFMAALEASLDAGTFVKLQFGKPRGVFKNTKAKTAPAAAGHALLKCVVTPVSIRDMPMLRFVSSEARKDITQNRPHGEALAAIKALIGETFLSAHLFTSVRDVALDHNSKGDARLSTAKPTFTAAPVQDHNRSKAYLVEPSRPYLKVLGVSQEDGRVKPSMHPKYKQICHFIGIIDDLIRLSPLKDASTIAAVDIGSGKGYLTFALYDFVNHHLQKPVQLTGVEIRADIVTGCNALAAELGYDGLRFEATAASQHSAAAPDLVIALHACDTATDDAIFHGISAGADLIVTAPCCQHELAPQIGNPASGLRGLTKYGLLKQRQADLVTDAARCLLLEAHGYAVKVIEFVSTEHTAKNLMIAATKDGAVDRQAARSQFAELKAAMAFSSHHLERRLADLERPSL